MMRPKLSQPASHVASATAQKYNKRWLPMAQAIGSRKAISSISDEFFLDSGLNDRLYAKVTPQLRIP